jgi:hypothetical protein
MTSSPHREVKKLVGMAIPTCFMDVRSLDWVPRYIDTKLISYRRCLVVSSPPREGGRRCVRHLRGRRGRGELFLSLLLRLRIGPDELSRVV